MKNTFIKFFFIFLLTTILNPYYSQNWQWAKSGDGTGGEGWAIAVDPFGNEYITGAFDNGSVTFGSFTLTSSWPSNIFLTKYDSNGNVIWAKNVGKGMSYGIGVDAVGNPIITGYFVGPTITIGAYTLATTNSSGYFTAKYDSNGNVLWAKTNGGNANAGGNSVSGDAVGNIFVTGYCNSSSTLVFGTCTLVNTTGGFLVKYDSNGNAIWATQASAGIFSGSSVVADALGNSYLTGGFGSGNTTFGTFTLTDYGANNVFVAKYDPNGNVLWAKGSIGTGWADNGNCISVDGNGNSYITGSYNGTTISFDSYTLTNTGGQDVFITKYSPSGNALWAKTASGICDEIGYSICSDANYVYISGGYDFTCTGTPVTFGTYTLNSAAGDWDPMFITKYDHNGNLIYVTSLITGGDDQSGIDVDTLCNVYITGDYKITQPSFVIGTSTLTQSGYENIFIAKLSFSCQSSPDNISQAHFFDPTFKILPNPNNGRFNLQIDFNIEQGQIILINSIGQKVHEQKITQGTNEIKTNGLPTGLYNYILLQNKQASSKGKLIIE